MLKEFKIKESNKDGNKLYIFDDIDINDIMKFLVKKNITVNNIGVIQDTIEDYYMSLMRKAI